MCVEMCAAKQSHSSVRRRYLRKGEMCCVHEVCAVTRGPKTDRRIDLLTISETWLLLAYRVW